MVLDGILLAAMLFFFMAGVFLHPQRSALVFTSELTAADERPARSSYLSPFSSLPGKSQPSSRPHKNATYHKCQAPCD
jgi:hypothetical protein